MIAIAVLERAGLQAVQDIISCLIDSALQRTPRGGRVRVQLRAADGGVMVDVIDSGTEMAERLKDIVQHSHSSQQVRRLLLVDLLPSLWKHSLLIPVNYNC
jgi:signal transduction histidine kinase